MSDSARPPDGSRPSDPRELVSIRDRETLRPKEKLPDAASAGISAALGAGVVGLYVKISSFNSSWHLFPTVPAWIYYAILAFTFFATASLAYRLIRP